MGKYFGTDGFRGEANVGLTVENAFRVGRFLGWYCGQQNPGQACRVVIGKDTRRSSYMFEYALVAGLTASGADAYLLHVTTTPSVSYVVRTERFDCGIMISASHNPYYDNGIKVINGKGEKLEESVIVKIEDYLDGKTGEIPLATREKIGRTVDYAAGRNRYIGYLISWPPAPSRGNGSASTAPTAAVPRWRRTSSTPSAPRRTSSTAAPTASISTRTAAPPILSICRSWCWTTSWTWALPTTGMRTAAFA